MKETYMVVELPKENEMGDVWINDPAIFPDYDKAFDYLNEKLAAEGQQIFKRPRLNKPIRLSLSDRNIELWVVRREESLTTSN